MKKFNLDRLNAKMIKLGESPIKFKRTTYRGPIIKNEMLKNWCVRNLMLILGIFR